MRNLIIDGAETKRRNFSSVDVAPRKRLCTSFSTGFFQKENIVYTGVLQIFCTKTDDILRTLLLMHDGVSFDKIQPKQVGYFGT
jgi:hypothetical protein